jgi:hypothetical protein
VAEWDSRSKIVLKLDDGKMLESAISGSRTDITIGGQKSARENIKTGMSCSPRRPGRRRSREHYLQLIKTFWAVLAGPWPNGMVSLIFRHTLATELWR